MTNLATSSLVLGYQGCDREEAIAVVNHKQKISTSKNPYDWLGHGIYFWEHSPSRAFKYAKDVKDGKQYSKKKIKTPAVLGAIIDLGNCLNLLDDYFLNEIIQSYKFYKIDMLLGGESMPKNKGPKHNLDCAVIEFVCEQKGEFEKGGYDSVRGAFKEGKSAFPDSAIYSGDHIQICIRDEVKIIGYFLPRNL